MNLILIYYAQFRALLIYILSKVLHPITFWQFEDKFHMTFSDVRLKSIKDKNLRFIYLLVYLLTCHFSLLGRFYCLLFISKNPSLIFTCMHYITKQCRNWAFCLQIFNSITFIFPFPLPVKSKFLHWNKYYNN